MGCIFCNKFNEAKSIEHIVPESFGNKKYVMQKGEVCDDCNHRFSKFENTALSKSIFVMERSRFGVASKKGRTAKGIVNGLIIEGDTDFEKNILNIGGLNSQNFKNFDPITKKGNLIIKTFDKSEESTSKLLLKMGLEAVFKSQKVIFKKYDFNDLKAYLSTHNNTDWPFLTTDFELGKFHSIPRYTDKYLLKQNHCELKYSEISNDTLLFKFKYGAVSMIINLIDRNLKWIKENMKNDVMAGLCPEHYLSKINIP